MLLLCSYLLFIYLFGRNKEEEKNRKISQVEILSELENEAKYVQDTFHGTILQFNVAFSRIQFSDPLLMPKPTRKTVRSTGRKQ